MDNKLPSVGCRFVKGHEICSYDAIPTHPSTTLTSSSLHKGHAAFCIATERSDREDCTILMLLLGIPGCLLMWKVFGIVRRFLRMCSSGTVFSSRVHIAAEILFEFPQRAELFLPNIAIQPLAINGHLLDVSVSDLAAVYYIRRGKWFVEQFTSSHFTFYKICVSHIILGEYGY